MNLKKFINKTNNHKDISIYSINKPFKILKVIEVINYYTIKVIIWNSKTLNIWVLKLNDLDILDDKLKNKNRSFFKKKLEALCLNNYFEFELITTTPNKLVGTIYPIVISKNNNSYRKAKESINTNMINSIANLTILLDKIRNQKIRNINNYMFSTTKLKKNCNPVSKLETIEEES